jgi:ABC-2 type transport system permease protein
MLSWVIPFAFASFYPASQFLRRGEFQPYFYLAPVVTIAVAVIAASFWHLGVRHYNSTGS